MADSESSDMEEEEQMAPNIKQPNDTVTDVRTLYIVYSGAVSIRTPLKYLYGNLFNQDTVYDPRVLCKIIPKVGTPH